MNCQEARELFDLGVDEALDAATAGRFDSHLLSCSKCQAAYASAQTESELLRQAMQADSADAAQIARIEARVRQAIRPAGEGLGIAGEWIVPVLGTLLGLLVLVGGRFDGDSVRQAICLSLNPRGGLTIAIASVLVVGLAILAVITLQSLMFRRSEQD